MKHHRTLLGLHILAAGLVPVAAPHAAAESAALEEIVVTARKREENLQEVPDSITAFSAADIAERRMKRIVDAVSVTPNVHMVNDQDAGTNIITVRGIGTNRNLPASIAFVVDGVILPDSDAFSADLGDVERIEVLKGPQGALYGRNAIGGVINLTTRRPTEDFSADFRAGYDNGESLELFGAASGALVPGKLLARVTARRYDSDGWIENRFDGENMDADESTKLTGRLIWQATEDLSFDLRGSWFDQDTGALWFSPVNVLDTTGGEITSDMARTKPDQNGEQYSEREITDLALVADWETAAGTFTSISARDEVDVDFMEDLDITTLTITNRAHQVRETEGWSQELRFTSPGDRRLRYIAGVYYQETSRDVATAAELDFCFMLPIPGCPTPPGVPTGFLTPINLNTTEGDFEQWAVFAQGNYDITEQLELTLALRYDEDRREQDDVLSGRHDEATFDELQPKVSLAWKPTDALMLYATYAEGYKSGAFNPPPPPGAVFPLVVEQEGTDSWELGLKSNWLDGRMQLNAAAFYTDYTEVQVFQLDVLTGGQVALNADEAELKGIELEFAFMIAEGLELNAAWGYTDAEFTDFDGTGLYDGNKLPNTPEDKVNIGLRYQRPLVDGIDWIARADYAHTGEIHFAQDNLVYQPDYDTLDLQLGLAAERWSVTLWGRNVTDENFATSAYSRMISPTIFGHLRIDPIQIDPGFVYGLEGRWSI